MSNVTNLSRHRSHDSNEWQLRVDLAAAFRLAAKNDWHEAVANHFSQAKCRRKVNTQLPFVGVMAAMAAEVGDVAHDRLPLLYLCGGKLAEL